MKKGIDYTGRISPASLKANGIQVVFRYIALGSSWKHLSKAELDDLVAAGIQVGLVAESTVDQMDGGRNAGIRDARTVQATLATLGLPISHPVTYAHDQDGSLNVGLYMQGAASVAGASSVGIYGGRAACEAAKAAVPDSGTWQTLAWSGSSVLPYADWYQGGAHAWPGAYSSYHVNVGGQDCDKDTAFTDWGLWPAQEEEMDQAAFDKFHATSHGVQAQYMKRHTNVLVGLSRRILGGKRPAQDEQGKAFDWAKGKAENPPA